MLFDIGKVRVEYRRVPAAHTHDVKPGATHTVVVINNTARAIHDLKRIQGKQWPWGKPVEKVTNDEWVGHPCKNCVIALNGDPVHGYVV